MPLNTLLPSSATPTKRERRSNTAAAAGSYYLCSVNSIMPGRQAWGDDDDDDYLPPRQESAVDSNGVKSIVEYHFNANGAKVKRTTKVKVFTEHTRVHKSCLERTQWKKFGLAAQVDDNASHSMKSMEEIRMETPQESREADEKPNSMEDTLKEAMERMRRKHAMRTAGLLESTNEAAPPEDEARHGHDGPGRGRGREVRAPQS
ncbi:unnamed protein product [Ectocarpus sp. CCAP 1310/34]|nr:unnamed protein product [Ectocarpus sp. CCAP 1310/34]